MPACHSGPCAPKVRTRSLVTLVLLALAAFAAPARAVDGIVGGSAIDINALIGADTFYDAGVTGANATVANIESGHYATDHAALADQLTRGGEFFTGTDSTGQTDLHATAVSQLIAGNDFGGHNSRGIAWGATLSSGAIGYDIDEETGEFDVTEDSVFTTYRYFFGRVDVINSSWGGDAGGFIMDGTDALARANPHTTFVASAGNGGEYGANTVGEPALGFNVISVGALGAATGYTSRVDFSSYGPSPFTITYADESEVTWNRATVHIVAPGDAIGVAYTAAGTDGYAHGSGTSFAAPLVAGGVALMADLSRQKEAADASAAIGGQWKPQQGKDAAQVALDSRDARVIKAVLLTSADKLSGWNNGASYQTVQSFDGDGNPVTLTHVWTTVQALDYELGAGALNLDRAFEQYTNQQWLLDTIAPAAMAVYEVGTWEAGLFVATLAWFSDSVIADDNLTTGLAALADLDLEIWSLDAEGNLAELLAGSYTWLDTVEHISLQLVEATSIGLRVLHQGGVQFVEDYDWQPETFALAWGLQAVPEPAAWALLAGGALLAVALVARRRRK
ncbi:PEP-CTERM putative exosortase interaction domain-containing protein [Opitutaceae bacterium TAV1]|nr:PEP-CTERM putative exosortase interaction domain-containing protein [Opitutaceae bacterium TAV1]